MGTIYFNLFGILISLRDVWSSMLLSERLPPITMLFYFSLFTSLFSFLILLKRKKIGLIYKTFSDRPREYLILGILTAAAFAGMMYGIHLIGASLFSTIEHGLIPFFTLILGVKLLDEKIKRRHILGFTVAILGVQIILFPGFVSIEAGGPGYMWGVLLAIFGSVLTALTSISQKKMVTKDTDTFIILFWRFITPTVLLGFYLLFKGENFVIHAVPEIATISLVGFILPLYFLLKGFKSSTMIKFSIFNLIIPIYTICLSLIMNPSDISRILNPYSIAGSLMILLGYSVSENFFNAQLEIQKAEK